MIKQIHNQLCLLAGKRVVLLEKTSSTTPAPPSHLMCLFFKVLKNWSSREECKDKLTSNSPRFFHDDFTINLQGVFNTLISSSCFIKKHGILRFLIGYSPDHQLFEFHSKCKVRSFPSSVNLRKNSALSTSIQSLVSLVPFCRFSYFHTPTISKAIKRVHMIKHMLSLAPAPLIGFNIKPCHLN